MPVPDGRWCAQVSLNGRRITKYAKTQKECRDWVNQTLDKIDHGLTFDGAQLSLAQYMESWLAGKALARRPSTVRNYRKYINLYILPALGRMRLQAITPAHIRQLYLQMQMEGRGERTAFLKAQGYTILRFWNGDVMNNIEGVLGVILEETSPTGIISEEAEIKIVEGR